MSSPPVRLFVDDQISSRQTRGGISRYFAELIRAYREEPSYGVDVLNRRQWSRSRHFVDAEVGRGLPTKLGQRRRVLQLANRLSGNDRPRRRADVVHHTFYDASYLRGPTGRIRAVTVYDMIPELFPELFPNGNPHMQKRKFVRAADLILAISESTKRDIVRLYGQPDAPIVVTPLAVSSSFSPSRPQAGDDLPPRYVLFVGDRTAYKDFSVLAVAFARARLPEDVALLAVGGTELTDAETSELTRVGIRDRVHQRHLGDAQLAAAYRRALCFVFPSRYEGFGLPTLEAMASGCPVILADSSSHPEVGGDAALYFRPGDHEQLSDRLQEVVSDPAVRAELTGRGLERVQKFSWATTAALTADAYRQALGSAHG